MPWSSFILSCHFEEFDYSQNVLLVLSLRLIQFIGTFSFMVRGVCFVWDFNIWCLGLIWGVGVTRYCSMFVVAEITHG